VLFASNGNSYTVSMQSDMCVQHFPVLPLSLMLTQIAKLK